MNQPKASCPAGSPGLVALGLLAMAILAAFTTAIEAGAQESPAKVNVGSATGTPGSPVEISVILFGNDPAGIGAIAMQIRFPRTTLAFVGSEPGLASLLAEAEVHSGISEGDTDSDVSVLEVTVSDGKALRSGTLASLEFLIAADAPVGTILLESQQTTARTANGEPLQLGKGDDGVVTVMEDQVNSPHLTCFFFSH